MLCSARALKGTAFRPSVIAAKINAALAAKGHRSNLTRASLIGVSLMGLFDRVTA